MATVITVDPYDSSKEKFKLVNKIELEMRKGNFRHKIEVDNDSNIIICYYDDKQRIHN